MRSTLLLSSPKKYLCAHQFRFGVFVEIKKISLSLSRRIITRMARAQTFPQIENGEFSEHGLHSKKDSSM